MVAPCTDSIKSGTATTFSGNLTPGRYLLKRRKEIENRKEIEKKCVHLSFFFLSGIKTHFTFSCSSFIISVNLRPSMSSSNTHIYFKKITTKRLQKKKITKKKRLQKKDYKKRGRKGFRFLHFSVPWQYCQILGLMQHFHLQYEQWRNPSFHFQWLQHFLSFFSWRVKWKKSTQRRKKKKKKDSTVLIAIYIIVYYLLEWSIWCLKKNGLSSWVGVWVCRPIARVTRHQAGSFRLELEYLKKKKKEKEKEGEEEEERKSIKCYNQFLLNKNTQRRVWLPRTKDFIDRLLRSFKGLLMQILKTSKI